MPFAEKLAQTKIMLLRHRGALTHLESQRKCEPPPACQAVGIIYQNSSLWEMEGSPSGKNPDGFFLQAGLAIFAFRRKTCLNKNNATPQGCAYALRIPTQVRAAPACQAVGIASHPQIKNTP